MGWLNILLEFKNQHIRAHIQLGLASAKTKGLARRFKAERSESGVCYIHSISHTLKRNPKQ